MNYKLSYADDKNRSVNYYLLLLANFRHSFLLQDHFVLFFRDHSCNGNYFIILQVYYTVNLMIRLRGRHFMKRQLMRVNPNRRFLSKDLSGELIDFCYLLSIEDIELQYKFPLNSQSCRLQHEYNIKLASEESLDTRLNILIGRSVFALSNQRHYFLWRYSVPAIFSSIVNFGAITCKQKKKKHN